MSDLLLQGLTSKALTEVGESTKYRTGNGWWAEVLNNGKQAKFWLPGVVSSVSDKFEKVSLLVNFEGRVDVFDYLEVVRSKIPKGSLAKYASAEWKNPVANGAAFVNLMLNKEGTVIAKLWDYTVDVDKPQEFNWFNLKSGDLLSMHLSFTVSCSEKGISVKMTLSEAKLLSHGVQVANTMISDAPPELTKDEREIVELFKKEELLKKIKIE